MRADVSFLNIARTVVITSAARCPSFTIPVTPPSPARSSESGRSATATRIAARNNRGQRLVDLVRNRGRHLTHRGLARHARKIRLRYLHCLFGTLAIGDVNRGFQK